MGAVANAEVPVERALEVAGIPAEANVDAISVAVHDEGFFKVGDMEGFEARTLVSCHMRSAGSFLIMFSYLPHAAGHGQLRFALHWHWLSSAFSGLFCTEPLPCYVCYNSLSYNCIADVPNRPSGWTCTPRTGRWANRCWRWS